MFESETAEEERFTIVHHAVVQGVMQKYPGRFYWEEIHSIENLRGIAKTPKNHIHLSKIRILWNRFYKASPDATRQQILNYATLVDHKFWKIYNQPLT